jgi:hypothetical protein
MGWRDVEMYLNRATEGSVTGANDGKSGESGTGQSEEVTVELGRTRYAMWKAMTKASFR